MTTIADPKPTSLYWFGRRQERHFLFDKSFQPESDGDIFLWEIGPRKIRFFKADLIRPTLVAMAPPAQADEVIAAYENWRTSEGPKYREVHEQEAARVSAARASALASQARLAAETASAAARAHRVWLRHWAVYPGIDMPRSARDRGHTSVCWSCKAAVSSSVNPTCRGCGWLVCVCGACNCNMTSAP